MNNVNNSNEDDEAMETASNVMETTTNSSSNSSHNTMDDEDEQEVTMEDAASPPVDVPMQDEEGNEEMAVAASASADQDEIDEPMEDKAELKEETMKIVDKEVEAPIPKKMTAESPEKLEAAIAAPKEPKATTTSSTSDFKKSLSLHDCLALGEIELGLQNQRRHSQDVSEEAATHHRAKLEIQRLPYILRLLSSTRPLASISIMELLEGSSTNNDIVADTDDQTQPADALVDGVVDALEDVAATYSIAEAVDVVTNHLAPSLTKKISRLKPLTHTTTNDGKLQWDTTALADVARDPITLPVKRKRAAKTPSHAVEDASGGGGTMLSSDDAASGDDDAEEAVASVPLKKRKQPYRRDSVEVAAEDSQEATFTKTLAELASLVVRSLENDGSENARGPSQQSEDDQKEAGGFALRTDDSVLSDAFRGANEGTGGAMEGSDLGSTVTAIMHHASVIRSRQLANALCRASLDQTGDLVFRLAANCPTSSPALLLGCIETYSMAIKLRNKAIANTAKECVTALAHLSHNECTRVYNKLQSSGVMFDVQLRLAAKFGVFQLSCLITQQLTSLTSGKGNEASTSSVQTTIPPLERQHSRDSSGELPDGDNEELDRTSPSDCSEPKLLFHLLNNSKLYAETLHCFGEELSKSAGNFTQSRGRWSLTFRALALVLIVPLGNLQVVKKNHDTLVTLSEKFCNALRYFDLPSTVNERGLPDHAATDNLYVLVLSCSVLLMTTVLTNAEPDSSEVETRLSEQIFGYVTRMRFTSQYLNRLWNSMDNAIANECPHSLFKCSMAPVAAFVDELVNDIYVESISVGLRYFCRMVNSRDTETCQNGSLLDLISRAAALLQCFDETASRNMSQIIVETRDLMRDLFEDKHDTRATSLIDSVDVLRFIREGTKLLNKEERAQVPFVLPAKLDETWTRIDIIRTTANHIDDAESMYLLRLLYSLEYLEGNAAALFAVEPWTLPIKDAMSMVQRVSSTQARCFLSTELRRLLQKLCPELFESTHSEKTTHVAAPFDTMTRDKLMETLYLSIRSIVNNETTNGKEDGDVNFLFLQVRSRLCDADLYSTISSAFLSSPHNPTARYSYGLLWRDPLVVLRYPLSIWSKKRLRRILLTTLRALLVAHNSISFRESAGDKSAEELLMSRDAIIIRCLLAIIRGGDSGNECICSATTSFIRWMVSSRPGLVGLLVKQGLAEFEVDWLIENVPETMNDAQSLLQILSDMTFMTASERLAAADTISRIAIVHGSDFNDQEAAQMTAAALSQLVDSFYLILGPVGVPVTALLNDDLSTDITQTARKAAFRILKALVKVRGRRQAFHICGSGLQKLASMCKGEVASVQGAVAIKRKQFLKEVFDAASRAVGVSASGQN